MWRAGLLGLLPLACATVTSYSTLSTFSPGAFIIKRQIGQLGFATETEWAYKRDGELVTPNPLDPSQPKRTIDQSGISVRLFDARLDDGRRVLLKEFIGDATELAENECAVYELVNQRAISLAQGSDRAAAPPQQLSRLLGLMRADSTFATESFRNDWEYALPNVPPPSADGVWLCFEWENLVQTVSSFPRAAQERSLFDMGGKQARQERARFVRAVCYRCIELVAWLHGQGIAHRSLGGASLLLNTHDQRVAPTQVALKAVDLGFAATAARISAEEVAAAMQRGASSPLSVIPFLCKADDLHALAYVLLELCLETALPAPTQPGGGLPTGGLFGGGGGDSALSDEAAREKAPPTDVQSLKRLVEDVFVGDVCGEFRAYCLEEPAWQGAVELLDDADRSGWKLIQSLVECRDASSERCEGVSAAKCLESAWFDVPP